MSLESLIIPNIKHQTIGKTLVFLTDEEIKKFEFKPENKSYKKKLKTIIKILKPHHSIYLENLKSSAKEEPSFFRFINKLKKINNSDEKSVINIGSLAKEVPNSKGVKIYNLDISLYDNIDIVANAENLPFADGKLDGIIIKNVFEHLQKPLKVRDELHRTLKKGGLVYVKIPFMQPFHAVPDDYQRYTLSGMKELFQDFNILEEGVSVGPASALARILNEYFAILFSFGNSKLYKIRNIVFLYCFFWIKYFDLLFKKNKLSYKLASAYYMILEK